MHNIHACLLPIRHSSVILLHIKVKEQVDVFILIFRIHQMASSVPTWAQNAMVYGSNDSFLILDIFPKEEADNLFYSLQKEVKWNTMRQRGKRVPRDICIQGTITIEDGDEYEPLYRHPADEQPELVPWTPTALKIKQRIEEVIDQKLNHALVQYYQNGKDNIGEHSDKTLDILLGSNIVNYSLGNTFCSFQFC